MAYDIGYTLVKQRLVSVGDRVRMMVDPHSPDKGWLEATVKDVDPIRISTDSLTVKLDGTVDGHGPLWGRVKVWVIGQNDGPKFTWLSESGEWAAISGANCDHPSFLPSVPISYGYSDLEAAILHDTKNRAQIIAGKETVGVVSSLWRRFNSYTTITRSCWYLINTADLNLTIPREPGVAHSSNAKRVIPNYPKTCRLCRKPAYLGLNEVIHDPRAGVSGCRGLVDP